MEHIAELQETDSSKIGVYSEYGTLREVVVGQFTDFVYPEWSPSIRYVHPALKDQLQAQWGKPLDVKKLLPERFEDGRAVGGPCQYLQKTWREGPSNAQLHRG